MVTKGPQGANHSLYFGVENSSRPEAERLWTVIDVAAYLQLDPDTVRTMARDGKLPAIKVGRVWRFKKELLEAYLLKS